MQGAGKIANDISKRRKQADFERLGAAIDATTVKMKEVTPARCCYRRRPSKVE